MNTIKGEGDTKVIVKTRCRSECDNCGDPATKRHSFCYVNGRRNPASSMYGRDDCTYCSDADAFSCDNCERDVRRVCCPEGMEWGCTFTLNDRNAHMFLTWREREATPAEVDAMLRAREVKAPAEDLADALEGRDFYDHMQAYRCAPIADQAKVIAAFEAVKAFVRSKVKA